MRGRRMPAGDHSPRVPDGNRGGFATRRSDAGLIGGVRGRYNARRRF